VLIASLSRTTVVLIVSPDISRMKASGEFSSPVVTRSKFSGFGMPEGWKAGTIRRFFTAFFPVSDCGVAALKRRDRPWNCTADLTQIFAFGGNGWGDFFASNAPAS